MNWSEAVLANAWLGGDKPFARGTFAEAEAQTHAVTVRPPAARTFLKPPPPADPRDWRDPRVGWGLVLPHNPQRTPAQLATADDAPPPIQELVRKRDNAPVFRVPPDPILALTHLRNWRAQKDIAISGSSQGLSTSALPQYLLIYGGPAAVSWDLQYQLATVARVGRLDLDGDPLDNYVRALLSDWSGSQIKVNQPVVWASSQGDPMTQIMRDAIAKPVFAKLREDSDIGAQATFLDGAAAATAAQLRAALTARRPGLIVTTSHGQTGPLEDPALMTANMGLLVDSLGGLLDPQALLQDWQPDGAIWYAHACCSAGTSGRSLVAPLFDEGTPLGQLLRGLAGLSSMSAPLPRALLGAAKPLRAFIGHVEPTFDWTLRNPKTGQHLTAALTTALYEGLFTPDSVPNPVGWALEGNYQRLAALNLEYQQALAFFNSGQDETGTLLYCQLTAGDVQSMVILGDPTAALPALT